MILAATIVDRRPYPIADRHPPIAHASILRRHGSVRKRRGIAQSGQLQCPPGIVLQRGTGDLNFESKALISRLTVTPGLARDMRSEASTDAAAHAAFPSMVGASLRRRYCACCRSLSIGCQRPAHPTAGSQWSAQPTASGKWWSRGLGLYRPGEETPQDSAGWLAVLKSRGSAQSLIISCASSSADPIGELALNHVA